MEEESRLNLARENRQLRRQEEEIRQFLEGREASDCNLQKRLGTGLYAWDYSIHKQFAEEGYLTLIQMKAKKREKEDEVCEERERLIRLMKERKTLETLKEKRFKAFLEEQERQEQRQLDEVALIAYSRGEETLGGL